MSLALIRQCTCRLKGGELAPHTQDGHSLHRFQRSALACAPLTGKRVLVVS